MQWGALARETGCYLHVGRVNTAVRIRLCSAAGADSFDGTSPSRFACTLPLLDGARRQPDLLAFCSTTAPVGGGYHYAGQPATT